MGATLEPGTGAKLAARRQRIGGRRHGVVIVAGKTLQAVIAVARGMGMAGDGKQQQAGQPNGGGARQEKRYGTAHGADPSGARLTYSLAFRGLQLRTC